MFGGTVSEPRYKPKLVDHHLGGGISAEWITFKSNVEAVGLEGLYGCTSIILVSRRGAWVSHIWQTVFENLHPEIDQWETLIQNEMPYGLPRSDPYYEKYEYGLKDMKDKPEFGEAGVMFDDDSVVDQTPASLNMRAFIVTPRKLQSLSPYRDANNQAIPHEILNDINYQQGTVRYPDKIVRLKRVLADEFGNIPMEVVDYNPVVPKLEHMGTWVSERMVTDDYGNVFELEDYIKYQQMATVRVKILLQYQPAMTCGDMAEWRLWIEGQPVGSRTDRWAPTQNQVFSSPGNNQELTRRQGQVYYTSKSKPFLIQQPYDVLIADHRISHRHAFVNICFGKIHLFQKRFISLCNLYEHHISAGINDYLHHGV
ncbi:uncharacterized protein ColSpa_05059 [Colletotrichum spaethianum]|uniref:Uncharacterized protein n=1 Tax=Colletotrichum spaethianum TaxID=700344 RepID=A0AA37LAM6_9PEZI|nr:uncharacterized protein ColSpa_05059 [Colletotrichum spaethianum]GKT44878.1 hypothetical protein ColSpa_05059 [Colletotrichum spaethianum]